MNFQTADRERLETQIKASPTPDLAAAASELRARKGRIKEIWEQKVRDAVTAAEGQTSLVLVNSMDIFLEGLVSHFVRREPSVDLSKVGMSKIHGGERAHMAGYFIPQLLKEFSILREVLNRELSQANVLTPAVRNCLDAYIDSAISLSSAEFVKVQETQVRTALAKAEASNRDLDRFAAVAAHDLRSPLATILGYLGLLAEQSGDQLGDEGRTYVQTMTRAAGRMVDLIDHLLEYSRLATVQRPFKLINLQDVVQASLQNLEAAIQKTNTEIGMPDSLPRVMGDADLLVQLFQNLIANGIKFKGDRPSRIRIAARELDGMWLISVADQGIGFDPNEKEDIFILYRKLETEGRGEGSGIGLATCRRVVEHHGGKIWAESKPGEGSTFFFTLPKAAANQDHH